MGAAFRILAPGAPYVQFTYGPKPPLPEESLEKLGLTRGSGPQGLGQPAPRPRLPLP